MTSEQRDQLEASGRQTPIQVPASLDNQDFQQALSLREVRDVGVQVIHDPEDEYAFLNQQIILHHQRYPLKSTTVFPDEFRT